MKAQLTECNEVSCMPEFVPPAFLRKQEGGVNSHKQRDDLTGEDLHRVTL